MKFDGLEINIPASTVSVDGEKVDLTPKEYDLLFYLVENKNIALSRDKLLSDIWGYDFFGRRQNDRHPYQESQEQSWKVQRLYRCT